MWFYHRTSDNTNPPVPAALNAALNNWLHHGKSSLVHGGKTFVFPARIHEDKTFVDDITGETFNDSYFHVLVSGSNGADYVWTYDNDELMADEVAPGTLLPPPINYVGFTQMESANIYDWLMGNEDCHDIRIRGNLILRYIPDDPYQLMTKYVSFGDGKDVPIAGYALTPDRKMLLDDVPFIGWYSNAGHLQHVSKCRALEDDPAPKHIYNGRIRNGPYYREAELPNLRDVPIDPNVSLRMWQWQIGKDLHGTFDIKASRRISAWLSSGKDDVIHDAIDTRGIIVLHHPGGGEAHSFSISGPGEEDGIAFEVEAQKVAPLISYEPTESWISTKSGKPFIGYQRFNEWIMAGMGNIRISNVLFKYPAKIIISGQYRVMVAETDGSNGNVWNLFSHLSIPKLNVSDIYDPNVNYTDFSPEESYSIKEWKEGEKYRHQVYLERPSGETFILSHQSDEVIHHSPESPNPTMFKLERFYRKFKRAKCVVCASIASNVCNACKASYYCGEACWEQMKCPCNVPIPK